MPRRTRPSDQSNGNSNNSPGNGGTQMQRREWALTILAGLGFLAWWNERSSLRLSPANSITTSPPPSRRPLQIFPLIKELRSGWKNMEIPIPLRRDAHNMRVLVVDVGLDEGKEFFTAIRNGFEVVGFEPNPGSFKALATACSNTENCQAVPDLKVITLPLHRIPGHSYLIHAGAGAENGKLELNLIGAAGSFAQLDDTNKEDIPKALVPVVRLDSIIAEDIFLLKIDTQGFDHFVLQGAQKIFQQHVVRQAIFEVEPYAMSKLGFTNVERSLELMQNDYGMICFTGRSDNGRFDCDYLGDSAEGFTEKFFTKMKKGPNEWAFCWEDFLCINTNKIYPGPIPPLLNE